MKAAVGYRQDRSGRQVFDLVELRRRMRDPLVVDRCVERLYGAAAVLSPDRQAWLLGEVAGGPGKSCRFNRAGDHVGRWHDYNPAAVHTDGDLIDAARIQLGLSIGASIAWMAQLVGLEPDRSPPVIVGGRDVQPPPEPPQHDPEPPARPVIEDRHASVQNLRRLRGRLLQEPAALDYLHGRGLTDATIARFHLGLNDPYPQRDESGAPVPPDAQTTGAITSPVIDRDGRPLSRMPKTVVPGLTRNARCDPKAKGWCHGSPLTYWSGPASGATWLFVAEGMKDLWRLAQEIEGSSLGERMVIITSTHGSAAPAEWKQQEFWQGWEKVFCGQDNDAAGERMIQDRVLPFAQRPLLRAEPPRDRGKDWTDFFLAGGTLADLDKLLAQAAPIGRTQPTAPRGAALSDRADGIYEVEPINVNGAWVNAQHLYYPFRVLEAKTTARALPDGQIVQDKTFAYRTMVLRSDGTTWKVRKLRAPSGADREDHVIALEDGTIITAEPKPGEFATWRWSSIQQFIARRERGDPVHRPLPEILADVLAYLRQAVWLPFDEDYALLACYVAMTYVFNVFDAIPQLLVNGPKGSGKSTTAEVIADLSYNGFVLGGGSEKSLVRFVDQGRGLLVLDDLEKVGRKANDNGYADINQILKLSYSKTAAKKSVTDHKTGITRILDFYGPKVVTNISGIDPVNATRMFPIYTQVMPRTVAETGRITGRDTKIADALRQELHCWGMAECRPIHEAYRTALSSLGDRDKQIRAPILALLAVAADPELERLTIKALDRQKQRLKEVHDPADYLKEAAIACVQRGARQTVSLAQIQLELGLVVEPFDGLSNRAEIPEVRNPSWISQVLRHLDIRDETDDPVRRRLYGKVTKIYRLNPDFVRQAVQDLQAAKEPLERPYTGEEPAFAFCEQTSCDACPYLPVCQSSYEGLYDAKNRARGASGRRHLALKDTHRGPR